MNKKIWYWVLGILAAVVVIALIWSGAISSQKTPPSPAASAAPTPAIDGNMDHGNMDHGPSTEPIDSNLRSYLNDQDDIMMTMMTEMGNIEHSGNAAIDFLAGMIPHHASAVSMAESYLQYGGTHDMLAPLAQDIITAQTEEMEQMEGMIKRLKAGGSTDEAQANAYLEAYDKLMDHSMTHTSASNLDVAYAEGMIMHHQMAVDMANAILPYTDDEGVKALAQNIVETQEQEITDMQNVINNQTT